MLNYILEVNLCWFGFYLLYSLVLSKETFFEYNRWYLLGGLISGLVIPLVEYQIIIEQIAEVPAIAGLDIESLAGMETTAVVVEEMDYREWLLKGAFVIYCLGVLILGLRFVFGLARIAFLYLGGSKQARPGYALIKTASVHPPFSFFHWLFQSQQIPLDKADEEKIITHEIEHIRQWHSLDVLLVELIGIVLWFSPLVWLYRRSLRMIHEYQADEAVLQTTKRKTYGHLLIRQSMSGPPIAIANHFIHSQLKKRLTMMTKKKSTQQSLMKYTFILPLLALFLMAFAPNKVYKVVTPETTAISAENPDPDLGKIKKALSAILAKRAYAKTNMDGEIAGKFARTYDEYVSSFPTHKKEITEVAVLVANEYEMDTKVVDDQLQSGQFRQPFQPQSIKKDQAVEEKKPALSIGKILMKDKATPHLNPVYVIDGKVSSKLVVEAINPEMIATINVFKGKKAEAVYGEAGANGVVEVYTKDFIQSEELKKDKNIDAPEEKTTFIIRETKAAGVQEELNKGEEATISIKSATATEPLFVVDDEIFERGDGSPGDIKDLDPNDIASINVLKDQSAFDKYGTKGVNGVVEIYTKGYKKEGFVDQMPRFGGCEEAGSEKQKNICSKTALVNYMTANMQYPKAAASAGIEGKVIVGFTVKKNGKVVSPKVVGGSEDANLQQEALRMVKAMPNWTPGRSMGKAVDVEMKLPFNFALGIDKKEATLKKVEEMPLFPGVDAKQGTAAERKMASDEALLNYIFQNIKYPKAAKDAGTEGTVIVNFIVNKAGEMEDLKIMKSPSPDLGKVAYRIMNAIKQPWTPGRNGGKAVAVELNIPIKFKLEGPADKTPTQLPAPSTVLHLDNFKLTPNPNKGQMLVSFQAATSPVLIQIFDVKGQEVYKEYLPNFAGSYRQNISLDNVAKGPHILSVTQNKQRFTAKFVTQ